MTKTLIIIPARFASSRFPAKALTPIKGAKGEEKSLIRRSWETACAVKGINDIIIATDDERIQKHAQTFGAKVAMTSTTAQNGTERCSELVQNIDADFDIIINFQGDAPLTPPWFVEALVEHLKRDQGAAVSTPILRCSGKMRKDLLDDRLHGRVGATTVAFNQNNDALYFSKEVIPFTTETFAETAPTPVFHHVGVYAYRKEALMRYKALKMSRYEKHEGLEQLRFIEHAMRLACVEVDAKGHEFWEVNNPEDVSKVEAILRAQNKE